MSQSREAGIAMKTRTYVGELEGTHGETGTELHGDIDILGGSLATLDDAEGLHHIGNQETVDDESI
jgi:hypothetical protein